VEAPLTETSGSRGVCAVVCVCCCVSGNAGPQPWASATQQVASNRRHPRDTIRCETPCVGPPPIPSGQSQRYLEARGSLGRVADVACSCKVASTNAGGSLSCGGGSFRFRAASHDTLRVGNWQGLHGLGAVTRDNPSTDGCTRWGVTARVGVGSGLHVSRKRQRVCKRLVSHVREQWGGCTFGTCVCQCMCFSVCTCDECTMYVEVDESARGGNVLLGWGRPLGGSGSGEQNSEPPLDRTTAEPSLR
jgi:hypothetical protein